MATVFVIDPSSGVRETLRIVLGREHEVVAAESFAGLPLHPAADLVVLGLPPEPRDDRAIAVALAQVAPMVPVLLLHRPDDVALETLLPPHRVVDFLAKPFDAYALRARVRGLLKRRRAGDVSPDAVERVRRHLEFPYLSQAAAAVARRAVAADLPVLLHGEPGTGAPAVAYALHVLRGLAGPFTTVDAVRLDARDLAARWSASVHGTLYLTNLERAAPDVQQDLVLAIQRRDGAVRLVTSAHADVGELAAAGEFSPDLAYAVTTLPIVLEPLRERGNDLPDLIAMLTRDLTTRLGLDTVRYSDEALARLGDYLWFGNVAELEAVLARTLAVQRSEVVDAEQLVFLPEDTAGALAVRASGGARPEARLAAGDGSANLASLNLEIVLGELAHELRNPMVTIKTFAQHLDSVLADPEVRARFSSLTTEAIGRMDGLLETLLDFSRFRAPTLQPTDLRALVDRVVGECAEELARRHVEVERNGAVIGMVQADEAQVLFALRSLMRGLLADLTPHAPLKIRGVDAGGLEMQVRTEPSTAARLAAYVEPHADATGETPPLAWALAATLLQRNGGALTVRGGENDTTVIRVQWAHSAS